MANSRKSRPTMPPISRMGMKTAISEMLIEKTVKPISRAPCSAACVRAHSLLEVARDVLHHHDGVVHHEAGGDGQRHEREIVEAVAAEYITANVPISETGTATAGNQRGPRTAQKQKDDHHHQENGNHQGALDVAYRSPDGCGAVEHDGGFNALGMDAFMEGNSRRMRSTVWMIFAPGCRKMMMGIARLAVEIAGRAGRLHGIGRRRHPQDAPRRRSCSRRPGACNRPRKIWSLVTMSAVTRRRRSGRGPVRILQASIARGIPA